jgi:hypothetical protein
VSGLCFFFFGALPGSTQKKVIVLLLSLEQTKKEKKFSFFWVVFSHPWLCLARVYTKQNNCACSAKKNNTTLVFHFAFICCPIVISNPSALGRSRRISTISTFCEIK